MTIQVTGKNVDAGDAFQTYINDKINTVVSKYIGPGVIGHIRLEKERGLFKTACSVKLSSGLVLEAHGEAGDAYASADAAVERLETRVRRHKQRLKGHHSGKNGHDRTPDTSIDAPYYVVSLADISEDDEVLDDNPLIIAETTRPISHLPVSEAVMQLDLSESPFLVFRNAGHGGLNVVYRRADGNIGWIDADALVEPSSQAGVDGKRVPNGRS